MDPSSFLELTDGHSAIFAFADIDASAHTNYLVQLLKSRPTEDPAGRPGIVLRVGGLSTVLAGFPHPGRARIAIASA